MWPMTGLAPASRIRGGTLDGPGPNMCRCGTASGRSSRCGGGTTRDDMFPAARLAEKWSWPQQRGACRRGGGPPFRPSSSELGDSDEVTTHCTNTGLPLNTDVNHWLESLWSNWSTFHLSDLICFDLLSRANDFSGFWCKVSLNIILILTCCSATSKKKGKSNPYPILLFIWMKHFIYCLGVRKVVGVLFTSEKKMEFDIAEMRELWRSVVVKKELRGEVTDVRKMCILLYAYCLQ